MMSLLTELGPFVAGDATNMPALTGLENAGFIRDIYMAKISIAVAPFGSPKPLGPVGIGFLAPAVSCFNTSVTNLRHFLAKIAS